MSVHGHLVADMSQTRLKRELVMRYRGCLFLPPSSDQGRTTDFILLFVHIW